MSRFSGSSAPHYHGPLLVRGRQLDGDWPLRFWKERPQAENRFYAAGELRLPGSPGWLRNGWRDLPSASLFKGPGCYGYRVDGKRFSRTIVVQVAAEAPLAVPPSGRAGLARASV